MYLCWVGSEQLPNHLHLDLYVARNIRKEQETLYVFSKNNKYIQLSKVHITNAKIRQQEKRAVFRKVASPLYNNWPGPFV